MSLNKSIILILIIGLGLYLLLNWRTTKVTLIGHGDIMVEYVNRINGNVDIYLCTAKNISDSKYDIGYPDFKCKKKGKF